MDLHYAYKMYNVNAILNDIMHIIRNMHTRYNHQPNNLLVFYVPIKPFLYDQA